MVLMPGQRDRCYSGFIDRTEYERATGQDVLPNRFEALSEQVIALAAHDGHPTSALRHGLRLKALDMLHLHG
jgi:hypothetical protein